MKNPEAIVVNAGPLIALEGIGKLGLLACFFNRVMVPETVQQEIMAHTHKKAPDLPPDIVIVDSNEPVDPLLREMLDRGEAGVIQTALA